MTQPALTAAEFAAEFGMLNADGVSPVPDTPNVIITALPNDRWDLIAWRTYGSVQMMTLLIGANPLVPISCTIAQGTKILAPIMPPPAPPTSNLPWAP
jgi:Phage Tail Protein X